MPPGLNKLRSVLIVSPNFPPLNAPDMQRVRMSLPYFVEFGWRPVILAIDPRRIEGVQEPLLLETIPADITIRRVHALPARLTRKVGLGDAGIRALPFLYRAGAELIKRHNVELVYFSTTMFPTMTLGRVWKKRFGIPFVLDMQDPWVTNYYESKLKSERPPKYWLSQRVHKILEPWTMRDVGGIIAVSESYHRNLCDKYAGIRPSLCRTIPFGASSQDYEVAAGQKGDSCFIPGDGLIHGVYVGVLGKIMRATCAVICHALKQGLNDYPSLFSKIRLHFIGTDYATGKRAMRTIAPIAAEIGVGEYVEEVPHRVPYFAALNLLKQSDFLIVPGSDDPHYTASKIYPYILAKKPLLAVFHERSSVVEVMRSTMAGEVVTFTDALCVESTANQLMLKWRDLLLRLPYVPPTNWTEFENYTARTMTQRQCELFDEVKHASVL